jgi:glutathione S-transferase
LLHLAEQSQALMPSKAQDKADTLQWLIAALNSVEMVTVPWWFISMSKPTVNPLDDWMKQRLDRLEAVLKERQWLAGSRFTVADIMMSDALRTLNRLGELEKFSALKNYVDRSCSLPEGPAGSTEAFRSSRLSEKSSQS